GLQNKGASTFFITVLLPLVFISVLIGVLNYFKILPFIIKYVGIIINKITRMGRLESYFAISISMLGQPEVYLTIKEMITKLSNFIVDHNNYNNDKSKRKNILFFQMIGDSATYSFKIDVSVSIMLLAFISLMEAIIVLFNFVVLDFKQLIGFIFAPIAFIIGIP